jgi:hypothetical protein
VGKRKKETLSQELLRPDPKPVIAKPVTVWDSPLWKIFRPWVFTFPLAGFFWFAYPNINQFLSLRGVCEHVGVKNISRVRSASGKILKDGDALA